MAVNPFPNFTTDSHSEMEPTDAVVNVDANNKATSVQILNTGKNYTKAYVSNWQRGHGSDSEDLYCSKGSWSKYHQ